MLAFGLILALTAHSALAKPTGNCIFMCETRPAISGTSGAYTHPGFSQVGSGFSQMGNFGSGFVRPAFSMSAPTHGNYEDFGTEPVYHQRPIYSQPQQAGVVSQVPVQPQIDGLFTHQSSKASYESNQGYLKIHQPGVTNTVISEPIRRPRPARICQEYYDPCV